MKYFSFVDVIERVFKPIPQLICMHLAFLLLLFLFSHLSLISGISWMDWLFLYYYFNYCHNHLLCYTKVVFSCFYICVWIGACLLKFMFYWITHSCCFSSWHSLPNCLLLCLLFFFDANGTGASYVSINAPNFCNVVFCPLPPSDDLLQDCIKVYTLEVVLCVTK